MGDISVENAELIGLWFQLIATGMCPMSQAIMRLLSNPTFVRGVLVLLPAMHLRVSDKHHGWKTVIPLAAFLLLLDLCLHNRCASFTYEHSCPASFR